MTGKEKDKRLKPKGKSPEADTSHISEAEFSLFTDYDISLLRSGKHYQLYEKMGAHLISNGPTHGAYFAVWAPNAHKVSVIGSFNGWNKEAHPMRHRWDSSGIWELFVPSLKKNELYKYHIFSYHGYEVQKADPYGALHETPPKTASVVWENNFKWTDKKWLKQRLEKNVTEQAISVYEVHLGSWKRKGENEFLSYRELAAELPEYCRYMGYTHVELMPVMEHPFYGSWGYQVTGYFAPSGRYGTPDDFMFLINAFHNAGIGVILDWVPSHFPTDQHGLGYFDGTHLYEHADPRKGFHQDWKSFIFNYSRNEVRSFLISNALFWLDKFHIDGLRVDAVASMLYLDYSRKHGEWEPNVNGGRENLEAVSFLKEFNEAVNHFNPGTFTVAEESTAWAGVTHQASEGGLGFNMKWMMGWMHDTLDYFKKDPIYRSHNHGALSFSIVYAFTEKFTLPLSHDEVVHGKRSLIEKMPGDDWQKFANLRLLYAYMYGHPGAKLLFMGGEFGQHHEWRHDFSLDWHENKEPLHNGIQKLVKDLNHIYRTEKALYENNFSGAGFEWIDFNDAQNSVLCWMRKGKDSNENVLVVCNFTPVERKNYRIGAPSKGVYREIFNSDAKQYGGSGCKNDEEIESAPIPKHRRLHSLALILPPLGMIILKKTHQLL